MSEKMVLSTSLLIAYENIASNPRLYHKKYKRLMKVLSLPYKTNKKQLIEAKAQGLNDNTYQRLLPQLQHSADRDASLDILATNTQFKVILTEEENATLPYLYYRSPFLSNQLTINLTPTENREQIREYLQLLCSNATKVTICDNYFAEGWESTQSLFISILPKHSLKIEYVETPNSINAVKNSSKMTNDFVQGIHERWSISESPLYQGSHDRYLLIESPQGTVELMISSGFTHLWKANPKEVTCIIKVIEDP